jgi:hypothetical protein
MATSNTTNTNVAYPQTPFLDPTTQRPSYPWLLWLQNPSYVGASVNSIVPTIYGGTGTSTTPASGQLPIGNGTGYTLRTLTAGTGIAVTNAPGVITLSLSSTGATAGTYGNAGQVPSFTLNSVGQITAASNVPISITSGQITGGATGTFKSGDATPKTITVTNGIITSIV